MEYFIRTILMVFAYAIAGYSGYLIQEGNYIVPGVNIVTIVILLAGVLKEPK